MTERARSAAKELARGVLQSSRAVLPRGLQVRIPDARARVSYVSEWNRTPYSAPRGASILRWQPARVRIREQPVQGLPASWPLGDGQDAQPQFIVALNDAVVHGTFPSVRASDGIMIGELSQVPQEPITQHPHFRFSLLPPLQRLAGRSLLLASAWGRNFYHWTIDCLPRLLFVEQSGEDLSQFDHFIVPKGQGDFVREAPQYFPALKGKLRELTDETHFICDHLTAPSWMHPMLDADAEGAAFVCKHILGTERRPLGSQRLFISRRSASRRRLVNEAEILEHLRPLGFRAAEMEGLSMRQQAELFADAEMIVAPHGAALANLVYAPRKCLLLELLSPALLRASYCFWRLSDELAITYRYLLGDHAETALSQGSQDFTVDALSVKSLTDTMISSSRTAPSI